MTDTELICSWMEPNANMREDSDFEWWGQIWTNGVRKIYPRTLSLDALHEVEARLADEQWPRYRTLIQESADPADSRWSRIVLHADAPTRIRALAAVLRGAK